MEHVCEEQVTQAYSLKELSPLAREVARDRVREVLGSYEPLDDGYILEDAKEIASLMGIEIKHLNYSGFSSQGDGASFTGYWWSDQPLFGDLIDLLEARPTEEDLHEIAFVLADVQARYSGQVIAQITRTSWHYSHENSVATTLDINDEDTWLELTGVDPDDSEFRDQLLQDEEIVSTALKRLMQWIYERLEAEYEYQTSDEVVDALIEDNEYMFNDRGDLWVRSAEVCELADTEGDL